ncbi:hypothetical protein Bhyg_13634 [Pseudolycoriella hygida]|uniref:Uncharacterized protein n=1 Tax=Pseudolycoriella hygida TaxID=35572 RepID=A0A9Q0RWI5_9DIPT|nr:hypothetical protein Bhyg_13634 [Pseudolycoriella hygida]
MFKIAIIRTNFLKSEYFAINFPTTSPAIIMRVANTFCLSSRTVSEQSLLLVKLVHSTQCFLSPSPRRHMFERDTQLVLSIFLSLWTIESNILLKEIHFLYSPANIGISMGFSLSLDLSELLRAINMINGIILRECRGVSDFEY